MYISDKAWDKYISMLREVNEAAAQEMNYYLATHNWWVNKQERKAALDFAFALSTKYGEAASTAACLFYDEIAQNFAERIIPSAIPAPTATYGEVAKVFNGAALTENTEIISSAIGRLVKQVGQDTTLHNALRDGAEFAWIPAGDTCAFCLTLASRGWQNMSKKSLKNGHAEHIHANCDCAYCVRFDGRSSVAGYDPDKYRKMYYDADGSTPTERINSMRREAYAKDKKTEGSDNSELIKV